MSIAISKFTSEHSFLSNFFQSPLLWRGDLYATLEHAFQAAKAVDAKDRAYVRQNSDPGEAKRRGRRIELRPDWEEKKIGIMESLLRVKFSHGSKLAQRLLDTGAAELIEGNKHGDCFWGVCKGQGQNWLGVLLMKVRDDLRMAQQNG